MPFSVNRFLLFLCTTLLLQCFVIRGSVLTNPEITSVKLVNQTLITFHMDSSLNFLLRLQGSNFHDEMPIRITTDTQDSHQQCIFSKEGSKGSLSSESPYSYNPLFVNASLCFLNVTLKNESIVSGKHLFLCVGDKYRTSGQLFDTKTNLTKWNHQGVDSQFQLISDDLFYEYDASNQLK